MSTVHTYCDCCQRVVKMGEPRWLFEGAWYCDRCYRTTFFRDDQDARIKALEEELAEARRLLERTKKMIEAKDDLLVAYRVGLPTSADSALTKLDELADVPAEIDAFLEKTK